MLVEIAVFNLMSAIEAERYGADRIELCSGLAGGGITPSGGMMKIARKNIEIPIFCMIRPREGDFVYTNEEIVAMKADIDFAKNLGMNGVVIGCLDINSEIDKKTVSKLVEYAYPLDVTFHRAIDKTIDIFKAIDDIIDCGCKRILTSGGKNNVDEGFEVIKKMKKHANDKIIIMPGSGVNPVNAKNFKDIGITEIHLSAKMETTGKVIIKKEIPTFGEAISISDYNYTKPNEEIIVKMKNI